MEITERSTIKDLRKYLKEEFAIDARFTRNGRPADAAEHLLEAHPKGSNKKGALAGFVVDSATYASDLIEQVRRAVGIHLELRNGSGIKVSGRRALGEARHLAASPFADSRTLDASIRTALNIAGDANYADADWIARIFKKAVLDAKTPSDRTRLMEAAIGITEIAPAFPANTLLSILRVVCCDKDDFAAAHALASAASGKGAESLADRVKELAIECLELEEGTDFP